MADIDDVNVKLSRPKSCPYCNGPHDLQKCRHPDILEFSQYLESMFLNLYELKTDNENKKMAAYNLLDLYSPELIRVSARNSKAFCFNNMSSNQRKNVLTNKRALTDKLTDCMFAYFKSQRIGVEGNTKLSFVERFKTMIPTLRKPEPSAPPAETMNEKVYSDLKGPSAPPLEAEYPPLGGKRNKSRKYRKHNRRRYSKRVK